jgi:hypothetical protein
MYTDFTGGIRDLGHAVVAHTRPMTLVLGAGSSLSSGAPTTPMMHKRLADATDGRFKGQLREHLHELVRREVRDLLLPLFSDVLPDVGYRLLGALGRTRRINVITLNWDTAAELGCDAAGVRHESFDPLRSDGTLATHEAKLPPNAGVLIVHVHGTIHDDARYGVLDTLPNHPQILDAIMPLLVHDTIVCGASLQGDLDVADVLQRLRTADRDDAAVWLFSRGAQPLVEPPASWRRVEGDDVDFDDLMIRLAEEVLAASGTECARWSDLRDAAPELNLPDAARLVELKSSIRRRALHASVVALVAPPCGKSVTGLRLSHLRRLIDGVAEPVRVVTDTQDAPSALNVAVHRGDMVTLVDDPFGQAEPPLANPLVTELLSTIARERRGFACVCSRGANWVAGAADLVVDAERIYMPPGEPSQWFEKNDLHRMAATGPRARTTCRAVHAGRAQTPYGVVQTARFGTDTSMDDWIRDKRRLLDHDRRLALLAVLVRLQQLRSALTPEAELAAIVACAPAKVDRVDALLVGFELDGRRYWRFEHATSREAVDGWMADHLDELVEALRNAPVAPMWTRRCLAGWALQRGMPTSAVAEFDSDEHLDPADWMAERLGSNPTEELVSSLPSQPRDQWATIEFTYELVRVWEAVAGSSARAKLNHLLDSPMGVYALLEACLYFGQGTAEELWGIVVGRLYALADDPSRDRELLLALNAVLWRESGHEPVEKWAQHTIENLTSDEPAFGIVRFAAAYYPDGLARLDDGEAITRDATHGWTEQQAEVAATLTAWHFAHQSRARVLLLRTNHLDQKWLCQEFAPTSDADHLDARLNLIRSLALMPRYAGWGFHIACNLAVVAGLDLREERARAVVCSALSAAPPRDAGVVSAVLAYRSADVFGHELKTYFADPGALTRLLDTMADGVEVLPGIEVRPPRFRFIQHPETVHATVGLRWESLDGRLPRRPDELANGLWGAAARVLSAASGARRRAAAIVIGKVERGDLRPVAKAARGADERDPFEAALQAALAGVIDDDQERLL